MIPKQSNWILYDGDCYFCSNYMSMVRLKETIGEVRLVNARTNPPELEFLIKEGFDINQGMALYLDGQLYFGADCINRIALLSSSSGGFNKVNYMIFRSKRLSAVLYPILRFIRNLVVRLFGKGQI